MLLDAENGACRGAATARRGGVGLAGVITLGLALGACAPLPPPPPPPARVSAAAGAPHDSLFSHPWSWTDEKGQAATFARWRGQPMVVTAIFTQCRATCPRTLVKLRKIYDAFQQRGLSAQFLIVTLDPDNDTPQVLQRFKESSGLPATWHLLVGNVDETRDLRDLLGIHVIDDGSHLLHDGRIMIFDGQGIATRTFGGWGVDEEAAL